jgi:dynactin-6
MSSLGAQIPPGAVVCLEAEIKGDVKIGPKTVVHPNAKIFATDGPIVIGEYNIIEELAVIENRSTEPLIIGSNNVFEIGCKVTPKSVGDLNVFETRCVIGEDVVIGTGCTFGAGTKIMSPITIPDNSVFFGDPVRDRIAADKPSAQVLQIDFLTRVLPNYHHVKATAKKPIGQMSPKPESSGAASK